MSLLFENYSLVEVTHLLIRLNKTKFFPWNIKNTHNVHRGINPPSKTPPPFFLPSPSLNLQTVWAPIFRQSPPLYRFFMFEFQFEFYPPLKLKSSQATPFRKFGIQPSPQQKERGGGAHYDTDRNDNIEKSCILWKQEVGDNWSFCMLNLLA